MNLPFPLNYRVLSEPLKNSDLTEMGGAEGGEMKAMTESCQAVAQEGEILETSGLLKLRGQS